MLKDLLGMWRLAVGAVEPKVATLRSGRCLTRSASPCGSRAAKGVHFEIFPTCNVMVRIADPRPPWPHGRKSDRDAVRFTATGRVWIDCAIEGSRLRVAVHDTGIGIPDTHRPGLGAFQQVGNPHRGWAWDWPSYGVCHGPGPSRVGEFGRGRGINVTLSLPLEAAQIFHLPGSMTHVAP